MIPVSTPNSYAEVVVMEVDGEMEVDDEGGVVNEEEETS